MRQVTMAAPELDAEQQARGRGPHESCVRPRYAWGAKAENIAGSEPSSRVSTVV